MSDTTMSSDQASTADAPLYGIMAEYDTPTDLFRACRKVRDAGYTRWDTYTPFPIHGIEGAMGIKMTKLPWFVICAALTGLATAILLQWWTNATDSEIFGFASYKWIISGKPFWSWPANVPIMFELTVLFSAFATLGGMLFLNNLPLLSHPLNLKERFRRVTDDKFFLVIEAADPKYDEAASRKLIDETSPVIVEDVLEDRVTSDKLPRPLVYGVIILAFASLVPFAFFAKARAAKTDKGRTHLVWDMDFTPAYKAQSFNPIFKDGRSMRPDIEGTVARGHLNADDQLHLGKTPSGAWATTLPVGIEADEETMKLGEAQFGIYCTPCHGVSGDGNGMVHKRAEMPGISDGWVPPSNLHQDYLRTMPAGEIFNSITNGVRNMPGYGSQIEPEERWAIILYIRALQKARSANVSDLSEADRGKLK